MSTTFAIAPDMLPIPVMPPISFGSGQVLVLNASYEPLHHVSVQHAIKMIVREVAVVEEAYVLSTGMQAMFGRFQMPKVLRLVRYVKMQWKHRGGLICTKKAVRARDGRCGYCGGAPETVDHIVPRSRGGLLTWENSIAACFGCNNKKANKTPAEARMPLLFEPLAPARTTSIVDVG